MKIEVDKDILQKSIGIADSIVSSKSINTVLSNCLFLIKKDQAVIVSTDNEIGIRTRCDAVSDGEKSFTVNGKRFASILKELPKGEVELHLDDNYMIGIKARSGGIKAHYSLVGTSSDEFPDIPVFFEDNASEISQSIFKDMLKRVSHAAALDTIKPVFNGIFLVSDSSEKLVAVATDSRRLSMISRNIANGMELAEGVIIPLKTSNELIRLLSSGGTCRFSLFENQCFFRIGETEIISRIVEGQFPNFKQVIPKAQRINVVINTQGPIESLRRATVFTRKPANKVVLHFKKDIMVLETKTPDLGESEEEISIESDVREELSIGINAQFLMDTLREIESDSINIGMSSQMSPVTICPEGDPDFLSVIMPIQIKSS